MSEESKFPIPAIDLPADWMRDRARSVQHAEFIDAIKQAAEAIDARVEATGRKCGGVFVLKGTRFPLSQLFAELADGKSIQAIAKGFELDRDQMVALLHALAVCLDVPVPVIKGSPQ